MVTKSLKVFHILFVALVFFFLSSSSSSTLSFDHSSFSRASILARNFQKWTLNQDRDRICIVESELFVSWAGLGEWSDGKSKADTRANIWIPILLLLLFLLLFFVYILSTCCVRYAILMRFISFVAKFDFTARTFLLSFDMSFRSILTFNLFPENVLVRKINHFFPFKLLWSQMNRDFDWSDWLKISICTL